MDKDTLMTTAQPAGVAAAATAQQLAAGSIAANTRRAYTRALARFDAWRGTQLETDQVCAAYLSQLFEAGKSPAVAAQVVAAVQFRARLVGGPGPVGPATARVLAGFRRQGADRGRGQVTGLRWEQADAAAAVAANGGKRLAGLRDAALIAVMSDALLRVAEVEALDVAEVDLDAQTVTIRRSKTDQEGAGVVLYLGAPTRDRVQAWLDAAGITDGALFRAVTKGGTVRGRLGGRDIRRRVVARATAVGIGGRVSGHSLRVGAAQSLAAAGASVVEMQTAGRWRSPQMPGLYARHQLAKQGAVARLRYRE